MIVAAAWDVGTKKSESITVYNCCTGPSNPMFWRDFELWGPTAVKENPFNDILWYPNTMSHHSWFWHKISDICFQYVPAYLMDVLSRCNGQKPKMLKIYRKLNVAMTSFEYFTTREWDFENYNMQALYERMCPQDKILFTLNLKEINWPEYMKIYCLGVRKYILKEHPDTLPAARKHLRRMYWLDKSVKFFCILVLWYGIFRRSGRALRLKALILYILLKISSR
ncbi:unnamed protein product [Allacma fusca]|nr:unnamed protein product [Allacma fusca]